MKEFIFTTGRNNVSPSKAIDYTKKAFTQLAKTESISDWQGNKDFEGNIMYVLRNFTLSINIPSDIRLLQEETGCDLPWAEDHFQERVSGIPSNPGETYKYWPYHNNLDNSKYKNEKFSHTYQERFWPKKANNKNPIDGSESPNWGIHFQYGDLEDVISLLHNNPLTRQAYLPIWFPEDTFAANENNRVPCTLGYYFWISDGRLHCNYTIRSCDLFRHFRNDMYLTARLMQHIRTKLCLLADNYKLEVGKLTMFIFNLHLFKNDNYAFAKKENKLTWKG